VKSNSASEMACIVSGGALNYSLITDREIESEIATRSATNFSAV